MYIGMLRVSITSQKQKYCQKLWKMGHFDLTEMPGFITSYLLRCKGNGDRMILVFHTMWGTRAHFETWSKSEEAGRLEDGLVGSAKQNLSWEGFEVLQRVLSEPTANNFSLRLTQLREKNGLSKAALGKLIGVTTPCVCKWETGGRPTAENIAKIASLFNISPGVLLCGSEEFDTLYELKSTEEIERAQLSRGIIQEARRRGWKGRRERLEMAKSR